MGTRRVIAVIAVLAAALWCAAPAGADIRLTPFQHDFGARTIGTPSAPAVFTLTVTCRPDPAQVPPNPPMCNPDGDHPLNPNVTVTGDFTIVNNDCTLPMPGDTVSGNSCTFGVVFTPKVTGERTGVVDVGDPDGFGRAGVKGLGTAALSTAEPRKSKKCKRKKRSAAAAKKKCKKKRK